MIDFDKNFEEFLSSWLKDNSNADADFSELESKIPEMYEVWATKKQKQLGNISPREYFKGFSPEKLIEEFSLSVKDNGEPCELLINRISQTPKCAEHLIKLLYGDMSEIAKMTAVNLLTDMGANQPLKLYVKWLSEGKNLHLVELAVEVLCEYAADVAEDLYALIPHANNYLKTIIAEILVNAPKDERTYNLLSELFALGDNIPLYAGYIGKYGDERASAMLFRALDTCNYMEYIEIKNAIERMGGIVDDNRDFADDDTFKIIKNLG